jgi:hypothetical protein
VLLFHEDQEMQTDGDYHERPETPQRPVVKGIP